MMHRLALPVALLCTLAACGDRPNPAEPAPVASARAGGAPTDVAFTFVWDEASAICGFPVQVAAAGKSKVIALPGGRTIATSPGLTATITNLDDGRSATLGITGAWHATTLANGDVRTIMTGRNLVTDPVAGFVLLRGRFSFTVDAVGNLLQPLDGVGQVTDVCALLE